MNELIIDRIKLEDIISNLTFQQLYDYLSILNLPYRLGGKEPIKKYFLNLQMIGGKNKFTIIKYKSINPSRRYLFGYIAIVIGKEELIEKIKSIHSIRAFI